MVAAVMNYIFNFSIDIHSRSISCVVEVVVLCVGKEERGVVVVVVVVVAVVWLWCCDSGNNDNNVIVGYVGSAVDDWLWC